MMRGARRVAALWSGGAVVAVVALAGPTTVEGPALVAVSAPTVSTGTSAGAPTGTSAGLPGGLSADPADLPVPPIPLPVPGQSLRDRAEQGKSRLDGRWRDVPAIMSAWGVDLRTGKLAIDVVGRDTTAVTAFLLSAGVDPTAVTMRTDAAPVRPYYNLIGGDEIHGERYRCSLGVNAKDRSGKLFVLTAGHCAKHDPGTTWTGYNKVKIGTVSRTNYPGDDFASIEVTNSEWKATAKIAHGGPTIKGSNPAGYLGKVCRSGDTTGYKCGYVVGFNQTTNYGNGEVIMGLTRTTACAEPGDSGGPFVTPSGQVQGFTSGGEGDCTKGGYTFFQPLREALQAYGLTLVTG